MMDGGLSVGRGIEASRVQAFCGGLCVMHAMAGHYQECFLRSYTLGLPITQWVALHVIGEVCSINWFTLMLRRAGR